MRNHRFSYRKLISVMLVLSLVFLAGCQSISNVNLNQVLKNSLLVKSSESKGSVELQFLLDEQLLSEMDEEEAALTKLFSQVKLELNEVKVQDQYHMSLKGKLGLGDATSIAFSAKIAKEIAVIEIEGAKQPFVLDMTGQNLNNMMLGLEAGYEEELGIYYKQETDEEPAIDDAVFTAFGYDLVDKSSGYIINNLPNPQVIKVTPTIETINGSGISLMHVHTEIKGSELWSWLKKYVDALIADQTGLTNMITGIAEVFAKYPEIWEAADSVNPFESTGELDALNTNETIKLLTTEIQSMLIGLQESLEQTDEAAVSEILNDDLGLKADFYVDSKMDIRKQAFEFTYTPSEAAEIELSGFKGVKIKTVSEIWNVNGTVKAEAPVVDENAVQLEELFAMEGFQALKQFDDKSVIYDLLKNKFHITHQSVVMFSDDYYLPPILTPSYLTIIPLRYTVEQLGGTIKYNPDTKEVTVIDEATGTTIVVVAGSNQVKINGKAETWPLKVSEIDGSTYVPARAFAEAIGADVSWEQLYDDVYMFTLEREL